MSRHVNHHIYMYRAVLDHILMAILTDRLKANWCHNVGSYLSHVEVVLPAKGEFGQSMNRVHHGENGSKLQRVRATSQAFEGSAPFQSAI